MPIYGVARLPVDDILSSDCLHMGLTPSAESLAQLDEGLPSAISWQYNTPATYNTPCCQHHKPVTSQRFSPLHSLADTMHNDQLVDGCATVFLANVVCLLQAPAGPPSDVSARLLRACDMAAAYDQRQH